MPITKDRLVNNECVHELLMGVWGALRLCSPYVIHPHVSSHLCPTLWENGALCTRKEKGREDKQP